MNSNYALQNLFEGVIPERFDEVMNLINNYSTQFRQICDQKAVFCSKTAQEYTTEGTFTALIEIII